MIDEHGTYWALTPDHRHLTPEGQDVKIYATPAEAALAIAAHARRGRR
jgi:hypothetical protein